MPKQFLTMSKKWTLDSNRNWVNSSSEKAGIVTESSWYNGKGSLFAQKISARNHYCPYFKVVISCASELIKKVKGNISKKLIAAKLLLMVMIIHFIKNDKIIGWSMTTGRVQTILQIKKRFLPW